MGWVYWAFKFWVGLIGASKFGPFEKGVDILIFKMDRDKIWAGLVGL